MIKVKIVYTSNANYPLTYGKVYDAEYDEKDIVYSSTGFYYKILNDDNEYMWYYYEHFTKLESYRDQKINNIL